MSSVDPAPGSTASLRTANQRRVLDVLQAQGADLDHTDEPHITQADLARTTGLAPATVSSIVRELAAAGLVTTVPGSGRRGTTVQLAPGAGVVAGIDFGHSHVSVAVGDLTGQLLGEQHRPLDPAHGHDEGLTCAADMLDALLAGLGLDAGSVRTTGLGLPAPVIDDVVRSSAILPGWVGVNARQVAEERFAGPVHIENDANLGALAEHRLGSARGHATSVYLKLSSGVGSGIIINGHLFHGASGTAGEVGHLTVDEQGPVCRCGSRGCLETYASTGSVLELMATQMPGATLDEVIDEARRGNVSALRSLEDAGLHLGWGLGSLVNLFNPALIVVGGDLARAGDLLLESARVGLRRHALDAVAATPVVASSLGRRASLVGAVLLAAERTDLLPAD
ncbi:ROK family transcriptional regulator [Nocardioides dongxiaopingii]|uniref:ROK family transcriptional regulator n=1 Tax=Nocardioides TaxID=1839 RepID=UPI0010C76A86|nr:MULTISPECIES: ROK family transcriptional regulator [Nocardioides]QCW49384.1 ROK family transcriptional regulator [Nocardioides sp. S-1144]